MSPSEIERGHRMLLVTKFLLRLVIEPRRELGFKIKYMCSINKANTKNKTLPVSVYSNNGICLDHSLIGQSMM